jgi:hypothetical protein
LRIRHTTTTSVHTVSTYIFVTHEQELEEVEEVEDVEEVEEVEDVEEEQQRSFARQIHYNHDIQKT